MTMICQGDAPAYGLSAQPSLHDVSPGLTKRELFAAMAMQGLRACGHDHAPRLPSNIAELAVADADALIAELSK